MAASVQYRVLRRDGDTLSWEAIEGSFAAGWSPSTTSVRVGSWDGQLAIFIGDAGGSE